MDLSIFLGFIIVAAIVGAFYYLKKRDTHSEEQLNPNKIYEFTYLFVFDSKIQAEALASSIQLENVNVEVTQSQNKVKWWVRFTMKDRPSTNYYIELESKLIDASDKYNGKYGYIDIIDPDAPKVEIV